jgi:hypothetical protein
MTSRFESAAREYVETQLDEFSLKHLVGTPFTEAELRQMIAEDFKAGAEYIMERVLNLLRSPEAGYFNDIGDYYGRDRFEWANWLESELPKLDQRSEGV